MNSNERKKKSLILRLAIMSIMFIMAIAAFVGYLRILSNEYINYEETRRIDYAVCFVQPNEFTEEECLPRQSIINTYMTRYIDYINLKFDYKLTWDKVVSANYNYEINGEIIIRDRNNPDRIMLSEPVELLNRQMRSINQANEINISEIFRLNYQVYNERASEFLRRNANIQATASLEITFNVESKTNLDDSDDATFLSDQLNLTIPLDYAAIQIRSEYTPTTTNYIQIQSSKTMLNYGLLIASIFLGLMGIIMLVSILIIINKRQKAKPLYEKLVDDLINDFDADITTLTNLIDPDNEDQYTYLDVPNFKELYDEIKKASNKQIYWTEKKYFGKNRSIENRVTWFFVFMDDTKVVRFIIDENEMEKKYKKNPDVIKEYKGL